MYDFVRVFVDIATVFFIDNGMHVLYIYDCDCGFSDPIFLIGRGLLPGALTYPTSKLHRKQ